MRCIAASARLEPELIAGEVVATSRPSRFTSSAIRVSSVAITTSVSPSSRRHGHGRDPLDQHAPGDRQQRLALEPGRAEAGRNDNEVAQGSGEPDAQVVQVDNADRAHAVYGEDGADPGVEAVIRRSASLSSASTSTVRGPAVITSRAGCCSAKG